MLPAILGLSGPALTADERAFFREADPAGFILFARNCADRGAAPGADRQPARAFRARTICRS